MDWFHFDMFTQLNPPIPMYVADKGEGIAIAVIDYGIDFDLYWIVAMNNGGEIWAIKNPEVRAVINQTLGRIGPSR